MSKTGQAAAVSPTSATLLINRVSAMVLKVAVATALPKTSCAHVVTAAGVTTISHENQARVAALTWAKHHTMRPERYRSMIAIARLLMDLKRDQLQVWHCRAVGQARADYTGPATGGRAALKAPRLERVTRQLHPRALVRLRNTRNVSRSESLSLYGSGSVEGEVTLGTALAPTGALLCRDFEQCCGH